MLKEIYEPNWWADGRENTYRVDYPLTEDSLFIDIGGNGGAWSAYMINRYHCHVMLFEPIPQFMEVSKQTIPDHQKVQFFEFALSDHNGTATISVAGVDSSLFKFYENQIDVPLRDVAEVLKDVKATLVSMNCEGSEFVILPRMIESGVISNFEHVQVQFHELYPDAVNLRHRIRSDMAYTHNQSYAYPFVWESWIRK